MLTVLTFVFNLSVYTVELDMQRKQTVIDLLSEFLKLHLLVNCLSFPYRIAYIFLAFFTKYNVYNYVLLCCRTCSSIYTDLCR